MTVLQFALLGLGAGAAYVLIAQGIVLIYRGSGLVNFAQGGMALLAAQAYYSMRDEDIPGVVAMVAALALVAVIGTAMQMLLLSRLQNASGLVRLMSTLGLMTLIQGLGNVWWGDYGKPVNHPIFSGEAVHVLGVDQLAVGKDRLYLLGIAIALTAVLAAVYHRTRFGIATSAVAENEQSARALGISPMAVGAANWALGSVLAGLAGIMLAPITGLSVSGLVFAVIPGLAAALVGQFSSFWLTLAGGLFLGVVESELTRYVSTPGWASAAPFLLIIAVVMIRGRALPLRGEFLERQVRVGTGGLRPIWLVPLVAIAWLLSYLLSSSWQMALCSSAITAIIGLSVVLITGYAGQLSLAQLCIAGVGALGAGQASKHGLPFLASVFLGMAASALVGLVVALPALRCRGVNLAVVTIGMSLAFERLILGNSTFTGGATGLPMGSPSLLGIDLNFTRHPERYTLMVTVAALLSAMVVSNIRRGRTGRRLLAVRSNERAAASNGVDVLGAKMYAFVVGAALAGLGGALADFQYPRVNLSEYSTVGSIIMVVNVVVGGVGFIMGGLNAGIGGSGGLLSQWLTYFRGDIVTGLSAISGALVLLTLALKPDGLFAGSQRLGQRMSTRLRRSPRPKAPPPPPLPKLLREAPPERFGAPLAVRNLKVRFGAVQAVEDVSFSIRPGEVVGLIGPNGAGKTTVIDAITGLVKAGGRVDLGDRPIHSLSVRGRALAGLARTFQSVELFNEMSVMDNIRTASDSRGWACYLGDLVLPRPAPLPAVARAAIDDLELEADLTRSPEELPAGRRQLVGIARALAGGPRLLLLDEPASGLDDEETAELGRLIRHLADEWQLPVLLVEHDIQLVSSVSDRVVAMSLGAVVAEGTPQEVLAHPAVMSSYLGSSPAETDAPSDPATSASGAQLAG
ncbi:branched-chain amino acid ABC transporter permease/ATP-binding protein, partial [Streptomyces justiciae]|uniref:branched-chain amino acid ABC transporter permease/ATP-binding protein n=1 Tax=Streptomyces justiciae TaxID=2780140 RepID=UPI0021181CE0